VTPPALKPQDPEHIVEQGYDRVAHDYARLEGEATWPRLLETAVETQVEGGNEVPYLWLLARK